MKKNQNKFIDTSLLITHYNRSQSLERLLEKIKLLELEFSEIVVSDDCSNEIHLNHLETLSKAYHFKLVKAEKNSGLAKNLNKGQKAITTPYTLYIQEDFVPTEKFPEKLSVALRLMNEDPELDITRFYAYFNYPNLKPRSEGFSEMIFNKFTTDYKKFYSYSDHPHLRRHTFREKFGPYIEGIKSDRAEYRMMFSFLRKNGKGLFYNNFNELFEQINDSAEPSTIKRNFLRENNSGFMTITRNLYRLIRFNFDYFK
jgi:glycosyltransferase involved in cell wall biosynthesis